MPGNELARNESSMITKHHTLSHKFSAVQDMRSLPNDRTMLVIYRDDWHGYHNYIWAEGQIWDLNNETQLEKENIYFEEHAINPIPYRQVDLEKTILFDPKTLEFSRALNVSLVEVFRLDDNRLLGRIFERGKEFRSWVVYNTETQSIEQRLPLLDNAQDFHEISPHQFVTSDIRGKKVYAWRWDEKQATTPQVHYLPPDFAIARKDFATPTFICKLDNNHFIFGETKPTQTKLCLCDVKNDKLRHTKSITLDNIQIENLQPLNAETLIGFSQDTTLQGGKENPHANRLYFIDTKTFKMTEELLPDYIVAGTVQSKGEILIALKNETIMKLTCRQSLVFDKKIQQDKNNLFFAAKISPKTVVEETDKSKENLQSVSLG